MTDISVVITAHREGVLVGATIRSALAAITKATDLSCEVLTVLDRCDDLTRDIVTSSLADMLLIETDMGDPGLARNAGINAAKGQFITFLDGDDLWSENWLEAAYALGRERPDAVLHSHCNMVFGQERNLWWHIDSEGALYDPDYMLWANHWDAMSFASADIYRRLPFRANDLKGGFGHEDWHWNVQTLRAGIAHKPVPGTMHFKRRRSGSQMAKVAEGDGVIWPV